MAGERTGIVFIVRTLKPADTLSAASTLENLWPPSTFNDLKHGKKVCGCARLSRGALMRQDGRLRQRPERH